jgi:branched-chain amino acid transport system substrate-binding protein
MSSRARRAVALAAVAASVGGLAACGSTGSSGGGGGGGETLNIGVPLALTGPIAAQAKEMVNGYNLYLKEHGNKLGGVPTKLFFEDTQAEPATVIAKSRKLIRQDRVHMLGGGALALESLATIDVAKANKIAYVTPVSSADDLTQRKLSPLFARPNMTSSQPNLYLGDYAYKKMGLKKVAIIAQDYAYGWESAGGFQHAFQTAGGEVTKKVWVPLDATDLTPYVRQLPSDVDAVYAMLIGAFVPRFVKDFNESRLKGKVDLIGGPDMTDEDALRAMPGSDPVGIVTVHEYSKDLPSAKRFVDAYRAAYKGTPSYWGESTYVTAAMIDAAIKRRIDAGTKAEDIPGWIRDNPEQFIKDFVASKIESPHGPLSMDAYHNAKMTLYIFRVDKPGHKEILETIPNASQFWTEPPKQFLEHPVFSRNYPPVQ